MKKIALLLTITVLLFSCKKKDKKETVVGDEKLNVVTTTTMITDLLHNIGGDKIELNGLMGTGVDPHLFKASEGDVNKLFNADVVFYNGLHLEGKLVEVFEKMKHQNKKTFAVADAVSKADLIPSELFDSNYDPHIWFSIQDWKKVTQYVSETLQKVDAKNKDFYAKNGEEYLKKIDVLAKEIETKINELPVDKRILVTAHDAFNYFGKAYDFEVVGLQGLSTATEAGVQDVQKLSNLIIEKKIKAIFVESSVPKRTIEALQAAVKSKGHDVAIGGELFSDALGSKGTEEGTYIGMYIYNTNTIVNALK
ncbi:metal ABC transporter solute-binding protein, Zn/Mn family [Aureivirga sp. CE67]|uniref:metal ABC transporter solute-binding protein, Zn/Mn family n=1 Tax=Aureivirga sp. CE67 TaxID=1788983 RepID=UPI0018CA6B38|nr:zinc ABC transporter substrate-binding protein [Aureivirga sp. CE67]